MVGSYRVQSALRCDWSREFPRPRWNGRVEMPKGELQAAGLNQPLQLSKTRLEWKDGARSADVGEIQGFGATWTGTASQPFSLDPDEPPKWNFHFHADHVNAAELDRWIGPRARPNWLRRLLPSLLGGAPQSSPTSGASELVRRVNAEGELRIDEFTMEKLTLQKVVAVSSLEDLHLDIRDASAQWAGGTVHGRMTAKFLPRPSYDVTADLDRVDLAKLPAVPRVTDRFSGVGSATFHITTQ